MKRHLKLILFLAAIAAVAFLIFDLRKGEGYDTAPALKKLATARFLGVKLLDIFLGILGLAFVGIAAGYVSSLVRGTAKGQPPTAEVEAAAPQELPRKKPLLEKLLGTTGAKLLSALMVTILILVVVAVLLLVLFVLFPEKLFFLRDLFGYACP